MIIDLFHHATKLIRHALNLIVMIFIKLTIAHLFEGPGCFDTTPPEINLVFYFELPDLDMAPN